MTELTLAERSVELVRTWIDPWLRQHPVVWAAAGHPAAVFSTTYDELVEMTGAVEVDVETGTQEETD